MLIELISDLLKAPKKPNKIKVLSRIFLILDPSSLSSSILSIIFLISVSSNALAEILEFPFFLAIASKTPSIYNFRSIGYLLSLCFLAIAEYRLIIVAVFNFIDLSSAQ